MKIAINRCYGGFSLSPRGMEYYLKLKGKKAYFYKYGEEKLIPVTIEEAENTAFFIVYSEELPEEGLVLDSQKGEEFIESGRDMPRNDPDLIKTIEDLKEVANGCHADLSITEIPDDVKWGIHEYDGIEHVEEEHRTWR